MVSNDGTTPNLSRLTWFTKYGKSVIAFLFVVYTVVVPQLSGDGVLDNQEKIVIAMAIANNLIVYIVPLSPAFKAVKSVANFVLAVLIVAQTQIADGWQSDDLGILLGAVVAALGVYIAPAASIKQPTPVAVGTGADK